MTLKSPALSWITVQLAKLKSTYTDALIKSVNRRTGRVPCLIFNGWEHQQVVCPHLIQILQNIPVRSAEGTWKSELLL